MELFTHLNEECIVRPMSHPVPRQVADRLKIPTPRTPALGPVIRTRYPNGRPDKRMLFRYGKRQHLEALRTRGELRLRPASAFDNDSLNLARRDKELEFEKIVGRQRRVYRSATDYYAFCTTMFHFDRLFWDFDDADSVLLIHDVVEFFTRLANAMHEPKWDMYCSPITYLDPVRMGESAHVRDVALVKHMRFTYQREHRFVAKPPSPATLDIRYLTLGSLEDITELLVSPGEANRAA
jgi:hypothetical protein